MELKLLVETVSPYGTTIKAKDSVKPRRANGRALVKHDIHNCMDAQLEENNRQAEKRMRALIRELQAEKEMEEQVLAESRLAVRDSCVLYDVA